MYIDRGSEGNRKSCFIIAEAGVNHNGDVVLAKKLIDAAKEAGADAVKFQTFKAENIVSQFAQKAKYQIVNTGTSESQYDMIKNLELNEDEFFELKAYADNKGIIFLSTPFDHQSVDLLEKVNVPLYKISSGDITNIPLLQYIGEKQKPVILSTGMSTLGEVEDAVKALKASGTSEITLLHCTTSYPAPLESVNLAAMRTLNCSFKLPVGYSDHTEGIVIPVAAAALGAVVIEKHFTLDKELKGPDHRASIEPEELNVMVEAIRGVESAIGDGIKTPANAEIENIPIARKSIVARKDIKAGDIIKREYIDVKRPGDGIAPKYYNRIVGLRAVQDIEKEHILRWSDLE